MKKNSRHIWSKLDRRFSKNAAAVISTIFIGALGTTLLVNSHAATPAVPVEAESGTVTTGTKVTDTTAAGSQAVKFAAPSTGGGTTTCNSTSTVKPDATNTGATATGLTVVNGNVTANTAGATISNEDIHGFLTINANNVTVTNTIVRGGTTSANQGFVNVNGTGVMLDHITVLPTSRQVSIDGIWGTNFTLLCSDVSGGVDGMKVEDNSNIVNNYVHGLAYFTSDPNQGGGDTHNDGIQILDGLNIKIQGNNLAENGTTDNSSIQITQDFGTVSNVTIANNWMDGGGCTLNIAQKVQPTLKNITATNNRFGPDRGFSGCAILIGTGVTLTQSGNVYDATNQPISIQQHD